MLTRVTSINRRIVGRKNKNMKNEQIEQEIKQIQQKIRKDEREIDELQSEEERLIEREHKPPEPRPTEVKITIDNKSYDVKPGEHTVAALKALAAVPAAKELEEIINGVLTPLADDAVVKICGGEVFLSHARRGGSSHV
jgi:hypothetical protein